MRPALIRGSIVWANITDANGFSKLRPGIVLTVADPVPVAAVTTRVPDPLPDDHVILPWDASGRARTRLTRPCAAVCSWVVLVPAEEIAEAKGVVPAKVLDEILKRTNPAAPESPSGPP